MMKILLLLGLSASSAPNLGEPFFLPIGESARIDEAELSVTFASVEEDSRCPKNATCIVAGKAVVVFVVASGTETTELVFEIPPGGSDQQRVGELSISLLELEPEPLAGVPIDPASYVARVLVERD